MELHIHKFSIHAHSLGSMMLPSEGSEKGYIFGEIIRQNPTQAIQCIPEIHSLLVSQQISYSICL